MKTAEELNALKEEVAALSGKLKELSEEELQQVAGGTKAKIILPLVIAQTAILHAELDPQQDIVRRIP